MSSSAGILVLLTLVASAACVTAQTESPWMTTTMRQTPQPTWSTLKPDAPPTTGTDARLPSGPTAGMPSVPGGAPTPGRAPSGPPIGTPPPPTGTPFPPGACPYPSNSSQVSLVVFDGEPSVGNTGEIGSCSCDVGKKAFYVGGPSADSIGATYATFVEFPKDKDECADLCIIDEAGNECKFSNTSAGAVIFLQPYCARGKCHMYVDLYGDDTASSGLICGLRNFTEFDERNADGSTIPMDPDTSPQGCAAIRNSNCLKPIDGTTTTTPTATTKPGPDCEKIERLVQTDAANSTILTTSLNAAWNGWSRPDKANFAMYKKRIENAVYEPIWSGSEKISGVSKILESYAPDGSAAKDLILAIPIAGWGTFCAFLNCAIRRGLLQATEKDCWKFTPTTPFTTTTASSESCAYPTNSSQVSLVVFDGEPRGGDTGEIGSCGCDVGKKAYYVSGPSSDTYTGKYGTFVEYPKQKDGPLACADFCIIDEAGDECKFSNTGAQMTIYFQPYCTRGTCHTYVYMRNSDDDTGSNGLICGSRNFTESDGWNDDGTLIQMDPDTSPQAFVHAAAFTCKGCAAIRNSNCLKRIAGTPGTPAPPNLTPAPPPPSFTTTRLPGGMPSAPGVATPGPGPNGPGPSFHRK